MLHKNFLNFALSHTISLILLCPMLQIHAMEQEKAKYAYIGKLINSHCEYRDQEFVLDTSTSNPKVAEVTTYKLENHDVIVKQCYKKNAHTKTKVLCPHQWKITHDKKLDNIEQLRFDSTLVWPHDFNIAKGLAWYRSGMPHYDTSGNLCRTDFKNNTFIRTYRNTGLIHKEEPGNILTLTNPTTQEESIYFNYDTSKYTTIQDDEDMVVITTTDGNKKNS